MSAWDLFKSLSSKSRILIIEQLLVSPLRYSEIMRQTGLSTTDVSRQLNRLTRDSIVEKTGDDLYTLTSFGMLVSTSIDVMQLLSEKQDFFNSRDLSALPRELLGGFSALRKAKFVDSIYESIELQKQIIPTIQERFWMMTDDLTPLWVQSTLPLIEEGVSVKAIITPDLLEREVVNAPDAIKTGMEFRTLEEIPMVIGYSDKHGLLCFNALNKKPDRNHYLFGFDYSFKHWAFHCFNTFWAKADPVSF